MRRNYYFILLIILFTIFNTKIQAQHVEAGDDVYLCPGETTASLHAEVDCSVRTGTYKVEPIQFQWDRDTLNMPKVMITELDMNNSPVTTFMKKDDFYSDPLDLPFDFSFFGVNYNQVVVGANADIVFNADIGAKHLDQYNLVPDYSIPDHQLPFWGDPNASSIFDFPYNPDTTYSTILALYTDLDPRGEQDRPMMYYKTIGVAPNRKFEIIYYDVPYYPNNSCSNYKSSVMVVLNESDCSVEIHVKQKPHGNGCNSTTDSNSVIGIQNDEFNPDTCGYYPGDATSPTLPNRNTGTWEIDEMHPEAYRFAPDGNLTYTWTDPNGNVLGNEADLEVQPTETTEYTVQITYEDCHGNLTSEFDTVTVYVFNEAQVEMPEDSIICEGDTYTFDGTLNNASDYDSVNYTWTDQAGNVVSNSAVVNLTTGGDYSLTVETELNGHTCTATFDSFNLRLYESCKIPEGISPNGDGLNDAFILDFYAGEYGIDTFQVFDRRGVLLYEKDNYVKEFVGKDNDGNDLPAATYYYVLKLMNGDKYTGWFQLIR